MNELKIADAQAAPWKIAAHEAGAPAAQEAASGEGTRTDEVKSVRRVLIVDDEPKTLLVMGDILLMAGYEVETARDGREALDRFERSHFDAIVTDIRMPGLGGIDLLEQIRRRNEDVPVILLTGYATLETATRGVARGAFDYLFKPIDFARLKQTLGCAVDRHLLVKENRRLIGELKGANERLEAWNARLEREVAARTRELAIERDLLEQIFAAIPSALALLNGKRALLSCNAAFSRLGKVGDVLLDALAEEIGEIAARRCEPVRHRVLTLRAGPTEERSFRVSLFPLADARALVVADDVTEQLKLEDELVQVEKLSSLGTLASGIAHDLASPLSVVLGMAQLAQEELKTGPASESLASIVQAAQYMREVCGTLTEFARRARSREAEDVDLNQVAEKAARFASYSRRLTDVAIERRFDPARPLVRATAAEVLQVLVNLVVNAADATPQGGTITISTEGLEGGGARVAVRDTGAGIPEALRHRLFEPFFTTKPSGKGTGLGLYIVRRIVRRLGGEVTYESGSGGTTFVVTLPAARPEGQSAP